MGFPNNVHLGSAQSPALEGVQTNSFNLDRTTTVVQSTQKVDREQPRTQYVAKAESTEKKPFIIAQTITTDGQSQHQLSSDKRQATAEKKLIHELHTQLVL